MLRESRLDACPGHVAVIGGGRWARVVIEVLGDLLPPAVEISAHSRHNAPAMLAWAAARGGERPLRVLPSLPVFEPKRSHAAIVVTAARDHEAAAEHALRARVPVLVEKPIALSGLAARRLADSAVRQDTRIAAAHVFLFASYLDHFAERVAAAGPLRSLHVVWIDRRAEARYGETKTYDSSLPVVSDALAHILSLLAKLTPAAPSRCKVTDLRRGGAAVELALMLDEVPCRVTLERNSDERRRCITAMAGTTTLHLDFSSEPGTIGDGTSFVSADAGWDTRERPLANMLRAFLEGAAGGDYDARLAAEAGVRACDAIDEAMTSYRPAMKSWLWHRLASAAPLDEDLRYALTEALQSRVLLDAAALERQIGDIEEGRRDCPPGSFDHAQFERLLDCIDG